MASPEKPGSDAEEFINSATPLERFQRLAKGVLAISASELKEAERRYLIEREAVANCKRA